MRSMSIPGTKNSLNIELNGETGVMELKGSSYPDNTIEFFDPIYTWLKEYIFKVRGPVELNLNLQYIDTSSTKCIFDLLEILETYHKKDGKILVSWFYEKNDEDMKETGEEFAEDIEIPFKFISY
ncbi:MAG: DUF1987 domain-containing protein [Candidatus Delongbacteria bacterium]|nr:DUF1987 domain-containing protein [Candidatus Delongbacteria bacterium]MBN2836138.1 DUF1987 domain-containing protein [Candidatus Delongbacteria bacterium]